MVDRSWRLQHFLCRSERKGVLLFLLTLAVGVWGVGGAKDSDADPPRYTDGAAICSGEAVLVCGDREWKQHGQSEYCKKPCGGEWVARREEKHCSD